MTKIFACGDIVNYGNNSGILCSDELEKIIKSSDYAICNFEAPVSGFGQPMPKSGPHLHQSAKTIFGLKEQGFDLLLLANNHILDYGCDGLLGTITTAQQAGLDTIGAGLSADTAYQPLIKNIEKLKIGIINACEAQFGVIDHFDRNEKSGYAWINHPIIDKTILALKKECDFVIVFSHAGLENYSIPQKEWRHRYKHLCDLGADVIIGSHPHVPQGYEKHNSSLIFYSLGNFYFDYGYACNYENPTYSVMLDLKKGAPPEFEPIFHATKNKKVEISNNTIDLEMLCDKLGISYQKEHDEMSLTAYEKIIRRHLITSASDIPFDGTIRGTLKELAATILGRRRKFNKNLTQLHFMRNEAYYYAATHALRLKAETSEEG